MCNWDDVRAGCELNANALVSTTEGKPLMFFLNQTSRQEGRGWGSVWSCCADEEAESYAGSMTSPVTDRREPPRGSLGPSPSRPRGGSPPGPGGGDARIDLQVSASLSLSLSLSHTKHGHVEAS